MKNIILLFFCILSCPQVFPAKFDLDKVYTLYSKLCDSNIVKFNFEEKQTLLTHGFQPWSSNEYHSQGTFTASRNNYIKLDTLNFEGNQYTGHTRYNERLVGIQSFGSKQEEIFTTDESELKAATEALNYTPLYLLNYFYTKRSSVLSIKTKSATEQVYQLKDQNTVLMLYIDMQSQLIKKAEVVSHDDIAGDVSTLYNYSYSYPSVTGSVYSIYPKQVAISRYSNRFQDQVTLRDLTIVSKEELGALFNLKNQNAAPQIKKEQVENISINKYTDGVYFAQFELANSRSMIVEFDTFLFIIEAPLNSYNGSLLIEKLDEKFPNKTIKYFSFSHHHPHYIGGIRPFIYKGATIIGSRENEEYLNFLATRPSSLRPDSLSLSPKQIDLLTIEDSLSIADSKNKLQIFYLGEHSSHTKDYIIYYLPAQGILFEGDLTWFSSKEQNYTISRDRERGLFTFLASRNIVPNTIVQSWPIKDYNIATIYPFKNISYQEAYPKLATSPAINTSDSLNRSIISSLNAFLATKNEQAGANKFWIKSEFEVLKYPFEDIFNIEASRYGTYFYKPTLMALIPTTDSNTKIARVAFIGHNTENNENQIRLIYDIVAYNINGQILFGSSLLYNTRNWIVKDFQSVQYIISPERKKYSLAEMKEQQKFIQKLCDFFETKSFPFKYYSCIHPHELFQIMGFNYSPNMYKGQSTGGFEKHGTYILSANNSEIYNHEVVHIYISNLYPSVNRIFNEGIATYLGGSGEYAYTWHKQQLQKLVTASPGFDFTPFLDNVYTDYYIGGNETSVSYVISAIICESIIRTYGKKRLLNIMKNSSNDIWQDLANVGINKEDFNAFIKKEVNL